MKIHALCIVKNEADILRETLTSALQWCDHVYVFDNGSDDGTWELVHALAEHHPQIVPYKQDDVPFRDGLRADIFNAFRSGARPQDWWCLLDADEFFIDDPKNFLAKIPDRFRTVWTASLNYYFTDQDLMRYQQNPSEYLKIPVKQRLHYYLNHWSVLRFFRHRDDLVWTRDHGMFPKYVEEARAYPVRILSKHYEYRSPEQIERRLLTRHPAIVAGKFQHEAVANWAQVVAAIPLTHARFAGAHPQFAGSHWEERVVAASSLDYDAFDGRYVLNEGLMPRLPRGTERLFRGAVARLKAMVPEPIRGPLSGIQRQFSRLSRRTID